MDTNTRPPGKTTVAPDVLIQIARLAALDVPAVHSMAQVLGGVNRLFQRGRADGVRIEVDEDTVYTDLYVVLKQGIKIREVSRSIQQRVARAIQEMVGMQVGFVNIHIEDIAYEAEDEA